MFGKYGSLVVSLQSLTFPRLSLFSVISISPMVMFVISISIAVWLMISISSVLILVDSVLPRRFVSVFAFNLSRRGVAFLEDHSLFFRERFGEAPWKKRKSETLSSHATKF